MRPIDFPVSLSRLAGRLPALPLSAAFSSALNLIVWRGMDWSALRGRSFCLCVRDTGMRLNFTVGARGFMPLVSGPTEVTFTATSLDFCRLALRLEDPDSLFFDRRLLVEGDTDLGLAAKNLLDATDVPALLGRLPFGRVVLEKGQALLESMAGGVQMTSCSRQPEQGSPIPRD